MIVSNEFSKLYSEGVVVYRQLPTKRTIAFRDLYVDKEIRQTKNYFLSFPYIFYSIRYKKENGSFVFSYMIISFGINSELNKLFVPALYNINYRQECCMGILDVISFFSLELLCKEIVGKFWFSSFNQELSGSYSQYIGRNNLLSDYNQWENKTKNNPSWIPDESELIISSIDLNKFVGSYFREK